MNNPSKSKDAAPVQDERSNHSSSESSKSVTFSKDDSNGKEEHLAQNESKAVFRLRLAVVLVLISSIVGVALAVNFYTKESEKTKFENQFQHDASKVLAAVASTLDKTMGALDSLAVTMVSDARALNQVWPFVTIADFGVRGSKILPLSKAFYIQVEPLVTPENRIQYESYTRENKHWVSETMEIQASWKNYYGPEVLNWTAADQIFSHEGKLPYNLSRPYLPIWQSFPVVPVATPPFHWDWLSQGSPQSIYACLNNHNTVVSEAYMIPDPDRQGSMEEELKWAKIYENYIPENEIAMEPVSDIFYPIIDELDQVEVTSSANYDPSDHEFVGMIAASFYWRSLIKDILPSRSSGVVVFTNPCNLPFTYKINGAAVEYMGVGDKHENAFDYMEIRSDLNNLKSYSTHGSEYTGAPLDNYCPFTLHLYPSSEMHDEYTTSNPAIFTAVVVVIFVFTSFIFLLYDFMVERRQKLVMTTAVRTSAIVSSLYPEAVREKLTAEEEPDTSLHGRPIADLYPETTVLFCDIVGFSSWSTSRQPWEVFHLLETIYNSFDVIASQRKVFKVETVGECYVAVVGLPTPRKNHATVMARFARDCRVKMSEVLEELEEKLGPGTKDLAVRFGLNSGPTTAGVLRGEKGRFQLFGDTVNTAARMESNGLPSRIQVSQSTADLLRADGKGHWLTLRQDLVNAKGKGLMQTFWCEPTIGGSHSGSSIGCGTTVSMDSSVLNDNRPESFDGNNGDLESGDHVVDVVDGVMNHQPPCVAEVGGEAPDEPEDEKGDNVMILNDVESLPGRRDST